MVRLAAHVFQHFMNLHSQRIDNQFRSERQEPVLPVPCGNETTIFRIFCGADIVKRSGFENKECPFSNCQSKWSETASIHFEESTSSNPVKSTLSNS